MEYPEISWKLRKNENYNRILYSVERSNPTEEKISFVAVKHKWTCIQLCGTLCKDTFNYISVSKCFRNISKGMTVHHNSMKTFPREPERHQLVEVLFPST